jgi:RHS repeat-associated protein
VEWNPCAHLERLGRPIHPRSRQHVLYFLALYDGHGERERSLYRPNNGHAWHLPASALCRRRLYPSRNERELRRRAVSRWSGQRERRAARKRGLYGHERCCLRFIQRKWSVHLQRSVRLVRKHHAPAERLRFHAILALLHQRDRAQTAQNYTATHNFQLIGTVSFNGAPLANVVFSATNGVNCTLSNASGQYSCSAPQGWSGTVTASLSGYLFTPATRHYSSVTANQSAQDYAAAPNSTYLVSGTVSTNGLPLANVTLAAANGGVCSPSNALGQYSCAVAPGWSGTVTPSASGYSFTPASRSLTSVGADQSAQDFAATLQSASAPMFYIQVDHLNTPRLVADGAGTTVWKWDQQEPYGSNPANENPSALGNFDLPLRFPGQYFDKETGLAYNVWRDYDMMIGRYLQSDLIGLYGGLNTYAYVKDDPIAKNDPLGLAAEGGVPLPSESRYRICPDSWFSKKVCRLCIDIACKYSGTVCCTVEQNACFGDAGGDPDKQNECRNRFLDCLSKYSKPKEPKPPKDPV